MPIDTSGSTGAFPFSQLVNGVGGPSAAWTMSNRSEYATLLIEGIDLAQQEQPVSCQVVGFWGDSSKPFWEAELVTTSTFPVASTTWRGALALYPSQVIGLYTSYDTGLTVISGQMWGRWILTTAPGVEVLVTPG